VKAALREVMYAESREHAREALTRVGAHLLSFVRAGIGFVDGVQLEGKVS
jgi:hypothetical protein